MLQNKVTTEPRTRKSTETKEQQTTIQKPVIQTNEQQNKLPHAVKYQSNTVYTSPATPDGNSGVLPENETLLPCGKILALVDTGSEVTCLAWFNRQIRT